jgi:flagellar motor switch protein FliG
MAREMNNEEKAALLILSLEEDLAARVLKNFKPYEIERITRNMSRISSISSDEINEVAKEFCDLAKEKGGIMAVTNEQARNIVVKALGEDKAQGILTSIERSGFSGGENPVLQKLRDVDPQILTDFTKTEHPQTIALILSHIKPDQAAAVMESFTAEMQCDIAKRMATLKSVPHEFIEEIANTLEKEITVGSVTGEQTSGPAMMAEILNRMNNNSEAMILSALDEAFPGIAADIRKQMFTFEDVLVLDDRSIQEILRDVSSEDLAKALKIVDEESRQKIYRNMSKRGAEMLKEELDLMPPTRLSDVEKSQRTIIDITRKLEAEGRLVLNKGEGGDQLV